MRRFGLYVVLLSGSAFAQEPAAPVKLPAPPSDPVTITKDRLQELEKRLAGAKGTYANGACAVPLIPIPIPPGVNFTGKVAPAPEKIDKMPQMQGLPTCVLPKR